MSTLNTLSAGYNSSSTKIRSTNTRPPVVDESKPAIIASDLANQIKIWHSEKRLSNQDINNIIAELQTIV
jgi:hypothetical protein|tara:strand:+ start:315 stop:524 length:210 start_codon:yes stop_codon:yes gene_type:complete